MSSSQLCTAQENYNSSGEGGHALRGAMPPAAFEEGLSNNIQHTLGPQLFYSKTFLLGFAQPDIFCSHSCRGFIPVLAWLSLW